MFNWCFRLSVVAIIARLGSTQSLPSLIKMAGCKFHISRNGNLGKISHSTKRRCVYTTRTLGNLSSDVMVFNTASLSCGGSSGGVLFPTDTDKNNTEDFCNKTECLAYTRRRLTLHNEDVLTTIGDTFNACKKYEIIKKPAALKFSVLRGTNSFALQYAIFNMTIPPTNSTATITSGNVVKLNVLDSRSIIEIGHNCASDSRVNASGTIIITNSKNPCEWKMETLVELHSKAIMYHTKDLDCDGGSLNFVTDYKHRSQTKDFCDYPKCLVFVRLRGSCNDGEVLNETVQSLFEDCKEFEWYIKPTPLKITKTDGGRNLKLNYTLFDCPEDSERVAPTGGEDVSKESILKKPHTTEGKGSKDPHRDRADKLGILLFTDCEEYQESKVGESATLTVANKSKRCYWRMRRLTHLHRDGIIYNTKGMPCEGGPVNFPISDDKSQKKDFCNHTKCLVYAGENSACVIHGTLNKTVQNLFANCKEFEWYLEYSPFDIKAPMKTTSFTLNYTLFNCVEDQVTKAQTTPKMSAETTARTSAETTRKMSRQETKHTAATAEFGKAVTSNPPTLSPVSKQNVTNSLKTDPKVNTTGQGRTSKKKTETKPWHYALPISLGTLLTAGVSILGICRRRTNTRMKGIVVAKYVATHLSESREIVNQKLEEVEESTLLT